MRAAIQGRCHLSPSFGLELRSPKKGEIINSKLSIRELEVVRLFAQDLSGREMARPLNRSEKTISRQKRSAMNKLDIQSNSQLAALAKAFETRTILNLLYKKAPLTINGAVTQRVQA